MAVSIAAAFVLMMVSARQLTSHLTTVEILLRSLGAIVILLVDPGPASASRPTPRIASTCT